MPKITVKGTDRIIEYQPGRNLLDILVSENIFVDKPCNGRGSCGKCKVKLISGELPKLSETETKLLKKEDINNNVRLSCLVEPEEDICISLLSKERKHEVLTTGYMPEFEFSPSISKKIFYIENPDLHNQIPYENAVMTAAQTDDIDSAMIMKSPAVKGVATGIFSGERLVFVEEGNTLDKLYGMAIDIGTTTVVCSLIDINNGKELGSSSMINAQKDYGMDVLTRITYEFENPQDGIMKLQRSIVDSINNMICQVCYETGIDKQNIYDICVAANCTMMHMLLGVDAVPIGKSPYAPTFVKAKDLYAHEIGLTAAPCARLYCLPAVSSYIGADIVAGAYVCQLHKYLGNVLFIDIGTNGEIVLSVNGKLLCCSCAAGPALEGMNISCGMRAAHGAIEDVNITDDGVKLKVIGDEEPVGICGSGILAAVTEVIRTGIVKKDGAFVKKESIDEWDYRYNMIRLDGKKREFILSEEPELLKITQSDIRQVQLAKGAILSGFYALLNKSGIDMDNLDKVMIAGQFGAHVSKDNLVGTGILPEAVKNKIIYVGNSSKTGAYMALMSVENRKNMEELANHMDYMELSTTEGYERLFAECLTFEN